ncbi:MAG: FHA domain-containing protein [Spirochaetia bacterium]
MGGSDTIIQEEEPKFKSTLELKKKGLLLILSGEGFGRTAIICDSPVTAGRDRSCSFTINDPLMSKSHFSVSPKGDGFVLNDLDSTNSTYLNKKKVKKPSPLFYGDRIVAGDTVFRFFIEEGTSKK